MPEPFIQQPTITDPSSLTTDQLLREIDRLENLMLSKMSGVKEIIEEKFISVSTQFNLIERQRLEQKSDTKAAKEAVKEQTTASDRSITKSETATTEQLKQLTQTFETAINGITDAISDVKERISRIESIKQGGTEQRNSTTQIWGLVFGSFGLLFGFIGVIAIVIALTHH